MMARYKFGPWIKHDGKGMPVDGDTLVCVRFPDKHAKQWETTPMRSELWNFFPDEGSNYWLRLSEDDDSVISEYCIVTERK